MAAPGTAAPVIVAQLTGQEGVRFGPGLLRKHLGRDGCTRDSPTTIGRPSIISTRTRRASGADQKHTVMAPPPVPPRPTIPLCHHTVMVPPPHPKHTVMAIFHHARWLPRPTILSHLGPGVLHLAYRRPPASSAAQPACEGAGESCAHQPAPPSPPESRTDTWRWRREASPSRQAVWMQICRPTRHHGEPRLACPQCVMKDTGIESGNAPPRQASISMSTAAADEVRRHAHRPQPFQRHRDTPPRHATPRHATPQ